MVSSRSALQAAAVFTALAFALPFSSGTASADPIPDTDRAQVAAVLAHQTDTTDGRDIGLGLGIGIGVGHHCHDWDDDWDEDWDYDCHHGHHGLLDGILIGIGVGLHIG
ncbi:hypothetical protein [Lentzea flaviverrucosa]|uniref:Uncharacterized protein n=1 Tax=Lentzea flaviverrucosa TaxID=200379 RepID=A0A1H9LS41_9PSEU|nr:hypothetical protein [Lentzea flaviverrucosa]RDI31210.1 hypothetical protein DFR72_104547 [Lentzea flaviverrucosa]SER14220.1 hypothetical protein SAMN05216195_10479 [Lentzea flaviverrucosa]